MGGFSLRLTRRLVAKSQRPDANSPKRTNQIVVDIFLHTINKMGTLTCSWCIRQFCQRSVQNLVAYNSLSFLLSILSTFPPYISLFLFLIVILLTLILLLHSSIESSLTHKHARIHPPTHFAVERARVWALTTSACVSVRIQPVGQTQRRLGGECLFVIRFIPQFFLLWSHYLGTSVCGTSDSGGRSWA